MCDCKKPVTYNSKGTRKYRRRHRNTTLFPPKLSMTELYKRIQQSPRNEAQQQSKALDPQWLGPTASGWVPWPHEILVERVRVVLGRDKYHTCTRYIRQACVSYRDCRCNSTSAIHKSCPWRVDARERQRHDLWEKGWLAKYYYYFEEYE